MRRILVLGVVLIILIGSGILTVKWGDDSATIKFNKERAKERTEQLLNRARELKADARADLENDADRRD